MERGAHPSKRILFVGHDAMRGGAQIALLHLLRWLRSRAMAEPQLILKAGGELEDEYRALVPTTVIGRAEPPPTLLQRALRRVLAGDDGDRVDLIYANTVATMTLVPVLQTAHRCPVICHVHELEMGIELACGLETFRRGEPHVTRYIAASRAVVEMLAAKHGVARERIDQIYESIPLPRMDREETRALGAETRRELGIPGDAFVVGGCGTLDWRKGADLFLQIAARVARGGLARPVRFVWVGGEAERGQLDRHLYDRRRLGLDGQVTFVGPQAAPLRHFAMFDTFLLSSREDPFPLVCLEAGALAIPIVCFADAGGMPELVADGAGHVVPYLDLEQAAACLLGLATDEARRVALGARAAERVRAAHDVEVVAPRIAAVLAGQLGGAITVR